MTSTSKTKVAEERKRSLLKTFSWRAVASLDTLILSFAVMWFTRPDEAAGVLSAAGIITALEIPNKLLLYYLHERFWARVELGRGGQDAGDDEAIQHHPVSGNEPVELPRAAA